MPHGRRSPPAAGAPTSPSPGAAPAGERDLSGTGRRRARCHVPSYVPPTSRGDPSSWTSRLFAFTLCGRFRLDSRRHEGGRPARAGHPAEPGDGQPSPGAGSRRTSPSSSSSTCTRSPERQESRMEVAAHIDALRAEGELMAAAVERSDPRSLGAHLSGMGGPGPRAAHGWRAPLGHGLRRRRAHRDGRPRAGRDRGRRPRRCGAGRLVASGVRRARSARWPAPPPTWCA